MLLFFDRGSGGTSGRPGMLLMLVEDGAVVGIGELNGPGEARDGPIPSGDHIGEAIGMEGVVLLGSPGEHKRAPSAAPWPGSCNGAREAKVAIPPCGLTRGETIWKWAMPPDAVGEGSSKGAKEANVNMGAAAPSCREGASGLPAETFGGRCSSLAVITTSCMGCWCRGCCIMLDSSRKGGASRGCATRVALGYSPLWYADPGWNEGGTHVAIHLSSGNVWSSMVTCRLVTQSTIGNNQCKE
eukprot:TRINITY_DN30135_c0_g1_i1.p1 TRINITY_DN30135_c0_g1~~TRINITY_DN30135_c0_g1_i1.p1  ORF type:complete len:242 (-),score=27.14 TRINITY_DN30135_c0_g1_i1:35-760(-)